MQPARESAAEGLIAITGSFFIAAEMRPLVLDTVQNENWYAEPNLH